MAKKIFVGLLVALVVVILIAGAVIRTLDRTGTTTVTQATNGNGQGRGNTNPAAPNNGPIGGGGQGPRWGQLDTAQTQPIQTLTVTGTVTSVDPVTLVMKSGDGKEFIVENRPWVFALESKFTAKVGDQIRLTGFDQAGIFETSKIENLTTGVSVQLRDSYGRPGWSGRGRNGGG